MEKINGEIIKIIYQKDSFLIGRLENSSGEIISFKANAPGAMEGSQISLQGKWVHHEKFGQQFNSSLAEVKIPDDTKGIISFLKMIKGVGESTAKKIIEHLEENVIQKIIDDPSCLTGLPRINDKLIKKIHLFLKEKETEAKIECKLASIGLSHRQRKKAIEIFGEDHILNIISKKPYKLIQVPRVTFKLIDNWVLRNKILSSDSPERASAVIYHALDEISNDGHTWSTRKLLKEKIKTLKLDVPIPLASFKEGMRIAITDNMVVEIGEEGFATRELAEAEEKISNFLLELLRMNSIAGSLENLNSEIELTEKQLLAVKISINNRVSIITGGPGVGKSLITKVILECFEGHTKQILAPTGKAAKRSSEITGLPATTIHRFIGTSRRDIGSGDDPDEVIPELIIIDEASMVGVDILASLFHLLELKENIRIIFVGDVDQLPSISPGNILEDLINSKIIPTTRLNQVHRQAADSNIIKNAIKINNGEVPEIINKKDFIYNFNSDPEKLKYELISFVNEKSNQENFDLINDLQVITGQRNGALGVNNLNNLIREKLNPKSFHKNELLNSNGDLLFREGDKVIVTENDYKLGVVNGDQGIIQSIFIDPEKKNNRSISVLINDEIVNFKNENIEMLAQSWVITCHKSQGSEYPAIAVICHSSLFWSCQKTLLYTAITRAKNLVSLYGDLKGISMSVKKTKEKRLTRLPSLLKSERIYA